MSRNVHELIWDIREILDTVECEYTSVIEDRDDLQEKIKDLDEKEKEFPKAYDLGFEEGFENGEKSMQKKAKKIVEFWDEANDEEIEDVFSNMEDGSAFENINESYDKIIDYEKEKEQKEKEIHVGDELVGAYGFKYVVTKLDGKEVCLVDNHGDVRHTFLDHEAFTKTGKHYPIDEILKEL